MNDKLKKDKLAELGKKMKAAGNNGRLLQKLQEELDVILELPSEPPLELEDENDQPD